MAKYRVGLIGCGGRQNDHVKAFREVAECEIVAVADIKEEARKSFSERYNIPKAYPSAQEMIQDSKVDIVTVVTRPLWMKTPFLEAIRTGVKGVLLEKPFGVNIEESKEMLDAAESTGTVLLVNHQYRFFDIAERMREIILNGELGDVEYFRSISAIKLHGQGTHMIDFVRFLYDDRPFAWALGSFAGKSSFDATQIGPDYDNGVVMFDNGVPLYVEAGQGSMQAPYHGNGLNLYADAVCTKGRIWFGLSHGLRIWRNDGKYEEIPCLWPQISDPAQIRLVQSLINTVETGEIGRCDARKGYATQEALCALLESAITHQKVNFPVNIPPDLMERARASMA
jgi:predicted dehydrogenase